MTIPVPKSLEQIWQYHQTDDGSLETINSTVSEERTYVSFLAEHFSPYLLADLTEKTADPEPEDPDNPGTTPEEPTDPDEPGTTPEDPSDPEDPDEPGTTPEEPTDPTPRIRAQVTGRREQARKETGTITKIQISRITKIKAAVRQTRTVFRLRASRIGSAGDR